MDYKNLFIRFVFSFLFVFVYFFISIINFELVYYIIILIYLFIFLEIFLYFKIFRIIPLIYISISFLFFLAFNFTNEIFLNFNLFIFIIIIFDIFSYIVGKLIGRTKLLKISPNKTLEGLFGGVFFSLSLSMIVAYFIELNIDLKLVSFILLFIISAFVGDILESFFKRKNYLKNSSELIPGHGGVFDRFDSFLFSIIFYSITVNI